MKKYRLPYTDRHHKVVAIQFTHHRRDYVAGDFYVRAIKSTTDIQKHNKKHTAQEDTEHIQFTIWGEEKAKHKIGEWKLPQDLLEQGSLEYKLDK